MQDLLCCQHLCKTYGAVQQAVIDRDCTCTDSVDIGRRGTQASLLEEKFQGMKGEGGVCKEKLEQQGAWKPGIDQATRKMDATHRSCCESGVLSYSGYVVNLLNKTMIFQVQDWAVQKQSLHHSKYTAWL